MEVIEVAPCDRPSPANNIRTRTFFIVEACLDEEALRTALDRLIRHHWRKLGGRIVDRPKDKRPEYHIPNQFADDYALFRWSSTEHDCSIDKVAAAIRSPAQDKGPLFLPPMSTVDSWFRPSDWPYHRRDEKPHDPFMFVHLSLFTDASVIAISIPHMVADQLGQANILKAWLGLLDGKDPPPMVGYEGDVLPGSDKAYTDYPSTEIVQKGRRRVRRRGEYIFVLLPFLPELVFHPKEAKSILFLPLPLIRSLKERCTRELKEKHTDFDRLSDGDVVTAVIFKLARMRKRTPRTVALSQTVNLRGIAPELGPEKRDGFIHNCLHEATARFRAERSTPLSVIAFENRLAIDKAQNVRDAELGMSALREMIRRGQSTHTCEPFERSYFVSNWCAAWKDIDFGPAVRGGNKAADTKPKFLVLGQSGEKRTPIRFSSLLLSRTDEGYWVEFGPSTATMKTIQEYLKKDPELKNL